MSTTEPVVFDTAIEGLLLRGLKGRVSPALKERLRALGVDLDAKLKPTYPRHVWVAAMKAAADDVFADLSPEDRLRRIGAVAIEGIGNTTVGKAIVAMAKLLGPERALKRLPSAYQSLNNFVAAELIQLGERHYEFKVNDVYDAPEYMEGAVRAAMSITGPKGLVVETVRREPPGATYSIRWGV